MSWLCTIPKIRPVRCIAEIEGALVNDRLLERLVGGLAAFLLLSALVTGISSRGVSAQAATPTTVSPPVVSNGVQSSSQTSIGSVTAAQQQLADKYAPIAMLKTQTLSLIHI